MTKKRVTRSMLSLILVFAMVLSLVPSSLEVKAAPGSSSVTLPAGTDIPNANGLYMIDWLDENDEGEIWIGFNEEDAAQFESGDEEHPACRDMYLRRMYLACVESGAMTTLHAGDVTVTGKDASDNDISSSATLGDNGEFIDCRFAKAGTYTITYNTYSLVLEIERPMIGFYGDEYCSEDSLLFDGYELTGTDNRFYMQLNENAVLKTPAFVIVWSDNNNHTVGDFIESSKVSTGNTYPQKYEIDVKAKMDFGLKVYASNTYEEDGTPKTDDRDNYVEVRSKKVGLVIYDDIDWETNKEHPEVRNNAVPKKYVVPDLSGITVQFKWRAEDGTETDIDKDSIDITYNKAGHTGGAPVRYEADEKNNDLTWFEFDELGEYTVSCTNGSETSSVIFEVVRPEMGFYEDEACTKYLRRDFRYPEEGDKVFYLQIDENVALREENPFVAMVYNEAEDDEDEVTDISGYFEWEPTDTDNLYKITVLNIQRDFGIQVYGVRGDYTNNPDRDVRVQVGMASDGLSMIWPDWDNNGVPLVPADADPGKNGEARLDGFTVEFVYVVDEDNNTTIKINDSEKSKFTVTYGGQSYALGSEGCPVQMEAEERNDVFTNITFDKTGSYKISYKKDDTTPVSSVYVDVIYPFMGFYKTETMTDAGYRRNECMYRPHAGDSVYLHINKAAENIISITGVEIFPEGNDDIRDEALTIEPIAANKTYKITVNEEINARFGLKAIVRFTRKDENDETEDDARDWYLDMYTETSDGERPAYTDGIPQAGYSGCFLTEYEYKVLRGTMWSSGDPIFYVHGDSPQDVIDSLNAISKGTKKMYEPGDTGRGEMYVGEIENTGYIQLNVSQFGNRVLPAEYVSSSGNLKGIIFNSSGESYKTVPDTVDSDSKHTLNADGDYVEDAVVWLDEKALGMFPNIHDNSGANDFVSIYKNGVYKVSRKMTFEHEEPELDEEPLTDYFLLGDEITGAKAMKSSETTLYKYEWDDKAEDNIYKPVKKQFTFGEILEGTINENPEEERIHYYYYDEGKAEYKDLLGILDRAYTFPELHVNVYCDMVFCGDYEDRYVGWAEGKDFNVNFLSNITKAEEAEGNVQYAESDYDDDGMLWDVVKYKFGPDTVGEKTLKIRLGGLGDELNSHQYKVNFFKLKVSTESDNASTYTVDDKKVTLEAPEPNALKELTVDQRTAIENGGELNVSIKADAVNAAQADASTKTAIDEINKELGKGGDEYAKEFIDLSVAASVSAKDGAAVGNTQEIKETKAPLKITVPLPKSLLGLGGYKVICYHGGKTYVIAVELSKDGKSITFEADRFSVYAIAGGKAELDISGIKWDYTAAFDYDGQAHTVKLTGLPEDLTVTYTGNTATEAGKYEAKATFTYDTNRYSAPDLSKFEKLSWEIKAVTTTTPGTTPGTDPGTPPGTQAPSVPEVGKDVETTNKDASFKVKNQGTAENGVVKDAEVVYVKPEKSEAKVTIPSVVKDANGVEYKVTAIDANAFKNDKKLTKVTIPATVETIGKNAFAGCKKLTTVSLGKGVEKIEQNAFANCTNLKKVEVTKSVTVIGKGAFNGCKKLKTITITSTKVTKIEKNAFKGIDKKATIRVPKKKLTQYKKLLKKAGFKGTVKGK